MPHLVWLQEEGGYVDAYVLGVTSPSFAEEGIVAREWSGISVNRIVPRCHLATRDVREPFSVELP